MNFDVVHSDRCEHSTLRAGKNFILIVQVNSVNYGSKMVLIIPSSQRVERRVKKKKSKSDISSFKRAIRCEVF